MKNLFFAFTTLMITLSSCNKCYVCTAQQEGETIEREVCGTNANSRPLVSALEADTTGIGPWTCTK